MAFERKKKLGGGGGGTQIQNSNFKHSATELCILTSSYVALTCFMTTINLSLKCGY
jgi:hypothetical protein